MYTHLYHLITIYTIYTIYTIQLLYNYYIPTIYLLYNYYLQRAAAEMFGFRREYLSQWFNGRATKNVVISVEEGVMDWMVKVWYIVAYIVCM